MFLLPQRNKFLEVLRGDRQELSNIATLRIFRTNRVFSVSQRHSPVLAEMHDYFGLSQKAMHMARPMVLRVGDESRTLKPQWHMPNITQPAWVSSDN